MLNQRSLRPSGPAIGKVAWSRRFIDPQPVSRLDTPGNVRFLALTPKLTPDSQLLPTEILFQLGHDDLNARDPRVVREEPEKLLEFEQ